MLRAAGLDDESDFIIGLGSHHFVKVAGPHPVVGFKIGSAQIDQDRPSVSKTCCVPVFHFFAVNLQFT